MKNTAIGNHAGPVGSITTSKRVPAGVPSNAHDSITDRLSTVGNALRFATVLPSSSRTRTACADAIPKSMPDQPPADHRRLLRSVGCTPARSSSDARVRPRSQGSRPTAAPTHVLQTDPTSTGRPTSLIRGIRGRVECDDQIDEARPTRGLPQCAIMTSPPEPAGKTMQPWNPDPEVDPRARCWLHVRRWPRSLKSLRLPDDPTLAAWASALNDTGFWAQIVEPTGGRLRDGRVVGQLPSFGAARPSLSAIIC